MALYGDKKTEAQHLNHEPIDEAGFEAGEKLGAHEEVEEGKDAALDQAYENLEAAPQVRDNILQMPARPSAGEMSPEELRDLGINSEVLNLPDDEVRQKILLQQLVGTKIKTSEQAFDLQDTVLKMSEESKKDQSRNLPKAA